MLAKQMLLNKCSIAPVILIVIVVNVSYAHADWEVIMKFGEEVSPKVQHRYKLAENIITIPSINNSVRNFAVTTQANRQMATKVIYVFRAEENAKTKINKDYFVGLVGGGVGYTWATFEFTTLPNANNEEMKFAVQLIGFSTS
ncbi:uncharacterized protein LOC131675220 [Phymastichus coffea]|uniref:uncharacterized protein LOC131675220 n=1 Tax=Phymastichus coffea TaxID=108790 RepID=UPI00273C0AE1|nr:uncharacterized protein LOC131675220 [Phymastichus coffea]